MAPVKELHEMIQAKLEARPNLTYRALEEAAHKLHQQDPVRFGRVGRSLWYELATKPNLVHTRAIKNDKLRTIAQLLWDGDLEAFARDTGLMIPLPTEETPVVNTLSVPVYLEGSRLRENISQRDTPELPCDLLYVPQTRKMAPYLVIGEPVGVRRLAHETVPVGRIAILLRESGLEAAWVCPGGYYAYENGQPFRLTENEEVFGLVNWIVPKR